MGSRDWLSEERFTEQIYQQGKEPENFRIFTIADTKEGRKSWEIHKWGGTKRKKILGVQKTPWKQKSKNWGGYDDQANMENGIELQTGRGVKRNSRIIGWISWVKDKVMKMMEGAHKGKKRETRMSFWGEMWKSKNARDTGRFGTKRESQKYGKGPTRRYNKRNEDNNKRNDRKKDKNENEVSSGKNANGKTVRPGTNKILRISPRWERQCEQIDKRRKKGQSKYDRPTEDRLANTSRTEDWFTESL